MRIPGAKMGGLRKLIVEENLGSRGARAADYPRSPDPGLQPHTPHVKYTPGGPTPPPSNYYHYYYYFYYFYYYYYYCSKRARDISLGYRPAGRYALLHPSPLNLHIAHCFFPENRSMRLRVRTESKRM